MNKVKILLDSACDLTKELLERYDLDYVPMMVLLNEVQYVASLSWDNISPKELYSMMRDGIRPYTSQVNELDYERKFREYLNQGFDIVYIAVTSGLSASINAAYKVKEVLVKEYPNQKINIVDSLVGDMGQGLMGIYAAELRDEGKDADQISEMLEKEKFNFHQCGTVDDLKYLKNAGRVSGPAAFFANLFGIKPILISDLEGKNLAFKKVKGRKASIEFMADYVKDHIKDPETHYISIINADCYEDALLFKEEILKRVPNTKGVLISDCGWIIGASAGPTTLNVYFYGVKRTQ